MTTIFIDVPRYTERIMLSTGVIPILSSISIYKTTFSQAYNWSRPTSTRLSQVSYIAFTKEPIFRYGNKHMVLGIFNVVLTYRASNDITNTYIYIYNWYCYLYACFVADLPQNALIKDKTTQSSYWGYQTYHTIIHLISRQDTVLTHEISSANLSIAVWSVSSIQMSKCAESLTLLWV